MSVRGVSVVERKDAVGWRTWCHSVEVWLYIKGEMREGNVFCSCILKAWLLGGFELRRQIFVPQFEIFRAYRNVKRVQTVEGRWFCP